MTEQMMLLHCAICGRPTAKRWSNGIADLFCLDPSCEYVGMSDSEGARNDYIKALTMDGVPVARIAAMYNLSRQRVYQVLGEVT